MRSSPSSRPGGSGHALIAPIPFTLVIRTSICLAILVPPSGSYKNALQGKWRGRKTFADPPRQCSPCGKHLGHAAKRRVLSSICIPPKRPYPLALFLCLARQRFRPSFASAKRFQSLAGADCKKLRALPASRTAFCFGAANAPHMVTQCVLGFPRCSNKKARPQCAPNALPWLSTRLASHAGNGGGVTAPPFQRHRHE